MFQVGQEYSRKDIYSILKVPISQQEGNWNTGYTRYNNQYFIFANIGIAGRSGQNHNNSFRKGMLEWSAKASSHLEQPTIKKMISSNYIVHIFTRDDSSNTKFIYQGIGNAIKVEDSTPVKVLWNLNSLNPEFI